MEAISSISKKTTSSSNNCSNDHDGVGCELRRGPWTAEEDSVLIHYISCHGEGRWNSVAKRSGLKRTGKSCRLRWLNYLKPDVKRGNLSPLEQLLILELHSKWGNRWSKIAQFLPGRTDNEIKNYWRTRVQKQAKLLKIDSDSNEFQQLIRTVWIPRLLQMVRGSGSLMDDTRNSSGQFDHQYQTMDSTESLHNISSSLLQVSDVSENPVDAYGNSFEGRFQNEYYNIDSISYESLTISCGSMGQADSNYMSDDTGHCLWSSFG